jgi:hypothetical protein
MDLLARWGGRRRGGKLREKSAVSSFEFGCLVALDKDSGLTGH